MKKSNKIEQLTSKMMSKIQKKENHYLTYILDKLEVKPKKPYNFLGLKKYKIRLVTRTHEFTDGTVIMKWFDKKGEVLFDLKVKTFINIKESKCVVELLKVDESKKNR